MTEQTKANIAAAALFIGYCGIALSIFMIASVPHHSFRVAEITRNIVDNYGGARSPLDYRP